MIAAPKVAVLCAMRNSAYHQMSGIDVFDKDRDARTFTGGIPVVVHAPCRAWSVKCSHQAKPEPGEKDLGLWCAEQLKRWGGILEHPAHSRLFGAAGLPTPHDRRNGDLWTIEVLQSWWGYPIPKLTWLCFSRITPAAVRIPITLRIHQPTADHRAWSMMSKSDRSRTTPQFARWLVALASTCKP